MLYVMNSNTNSETVQLKRLCRIPLAILHFLESLHCAVERMSMVSPELRVGAFEGRITVGLRLFDTVPVGLLRLIVLGGVL